MTAPAAAALINLLGYITGAALYAMLLVMALGRQRVASSIGVGGASSEKTDRLPLLTALLGLTWNLGALTAFVMRGFASVRSHPLLMATAFTSLGFLPAVVVHSLVGASEQELAHGRACGIGLQNVEQRIKRHYGGAATFDIRSASGVGATVKLGLPINLANVSIDGATALDFQQTSARMYG